MVEGTYSVGHFPEVPTGSFSKSTVSSLQTVLDAHGQGTWLARCYGNRYGC